MKDRETKAEFIVMRAQGLRYEEIGEELNVSKPTMIKWNREFAEIIENTKIEIIEDLVSKIYRKNREIALNQFEILLRTSQPEPGMEKIATKYEKKAAKKLEDLFKIKIYALNLEFNRKQDLVKVRIECSKPQNQKD